MKLRLSDTLNSLMLGGLLMASTFASADNKPTKPYWQDVQVVAVNKEYPRSSFMTYENRANALTGKFEKSKYYQLLNGTWKFYFVDSYKNLPANITDPAISTADWADIKVPGNWEVQGHGVAIYTNHGYEFQPRNPQPPTLPEANPVGVYRRDIDIPADWDGRDIYLHLAGAKSGVYVYINGQEVGYSEDSKNSAEFLINKFVKPGKNVLTLKISLLTTQSRAQRFPCNIDSGRYIQRRYLQTGRRPEKQRFDSRQYDVGIRTARCQWQSSGNRRESN